MEDELPFLRQNYTIHTYIHAYFVVERFSPIAAQYDKSPKRYGRSLWVYANDSMIIVKIKINYQYDGAPVIAIV